MIMKGHVNFNFWWIKFCALLEYNNFAVGRLVEVFQHRYTECTCTSSSEQANKAKYYINLIDIESVLNTKQEYDHYFIVAMKQSILFHSSLGWDVEQGNVSDQGISPDTLISLTCPKLCARSFKGRKHYLGLRMIPKELSDRFKLVLPRYPGLDTIVELTHEH